MGHFNRGGDRSRSGFDRKSSGGQRPSGRGGDRPTMHRATCSDCGNNCELPFRPTGSRPVFCSDCFGKQDGGNDRSGGNNRQDRFSDERRDKGRYRDKEMHKAVCDECGDNCEVPFRPTKGKDIFCNSCFGSNDGGSKDNKSKNSGSGEVTEQIKMLNSKMDKLMKILSPENAPTEELLFDSPEKMVPSDESEKKGKKTKVKKEKVKKTKVKKAEKPKTVKKVEKSKKKTTTKKTPAKKKS